MALDLQSRKSMTHYHSEKLCLFIITLVFLLSSPIFATEIPSFETVKHSIQKSELVILDRNGKALHDIRNNKLTRRMNWINLESISTAVIHSLLVAEDKRFFEHKGVDW